MKKALLAGSFDPLTLGHLWIINESKRLFDLAVGIASNPDKNYYLSLEERINILKKSIHDIEIHCITDDYTVSYANQIGADYLVRGIRDHNDFEYERLINNVNHRLNNKITTIYLIPSNELSHISSSLVKGLIGYKGWEDSIKQFVPRETYNILLIKNRGYFDRWLSTFSKVTNNINKINDLYDDLLFKYKDNRRAYHNFVNIIECLNEFDRIKEYIKDPVSFEIALWYKNYEFNRNRKIAKEESAAELRENLYKLRAGSKLINKASNLILAQINKIPNSSDSKYFLDISVRFLGKDYNEFKEVIRLLRYEYEEEPYIFNRILKSSFMSYLMRDNIYYTDHFRAMYEEKARDNIEAYMKEEL